MQFPPCAGPWPCLLPSPSPLQGPSAQGPPEGAPPRQGTWKWGWAIPDWGSVVGSCRARPRGRVWALLPLAPPAGPSAGLSLGSLSPHEHLLRLSQLVLAAALSVKGGCYRQSIFPLSSLGVPPVLHNSMLQGCPQWGNTGTSARGHCIPVWLELGLRPRREGGEGELSAGLAENEQGLLQNDQCRSGGEGERPGPALMARAEVPVGKEPEHLYLALDPIPGGCRRWETEPCPDTGASPHSCREC